MKWFVGLSLRGRTVTVGTLLSLILILVGAVVPIPYVAVGPGSTFNTLGAVGPVDVIQFSGPGIPASATGPLPDGHLNMTTISVYDHQTLFGALGLWAHGSFVISPREEFYPPNKTREQVNQENAQMFTDSQSNAEIAALRYLDYPDVVYVGTITESSPSYGKLEPQDQIVAIDGRKVTDYDSLKVTLATTKPGQQVKVEVLRDGKTAVATVTLTASSDVGPQGFLGIAATERPYAPFTITIHLSDIGGPSAGLMFTLGIIDRLTPGDLTAGTFVAGTGTMEVDDDKGTVGAIGGVTLKEITARRAGAEFFLVPAPNCAEAMTNIPAGLRLVKVIALDDAVSAVKTIAAGGSPPGC